MGKEKLIPTLAFIVILIGGLSSIYVYATQINSEYININGQEYTIDQLFFIGEERTFETFSGIALDNLMIKIGIPEPEKHEYTIIASDGYQKTVKWENMKNGLLTEEGQSIFSDLPKAFRIKDIVKIEVN
jgi:hypothetical protein